LCTQRHSNSNLVPPLARAVGYDSVNANQDTRIVGCGQTILAKDGTEFLTARGRRVIRPSQTRNSEEIYVITRKPGGSTTAIKAIND
jgi:hypothetical protein